MKIVRAEIILSELVREDADWRWARGGGGKKHCFIVKLRSESDVVGLGYAGISSHHGDSLGGVKSALETYTGLLIGEDPFNVEKISETLSSTLRGNEAANAAIDVALHDLQAKILGLPLYALLGGLVREEIPVIRILSLKEPAKMATNAVKLAKEGYSFFKIKLSGEQTKDLQRVKEIRNAVGEMIHLTVDANQTYQPKGAIATLKRMEEYRVELCEQPVRADDWEGLAAVTRAVDCLVEAHESALRLEHIYGLVKNKVVDCINIKLDQLGGLRKAKIAAAICKLGNVSVRAGSMGSRLSAAASMHFVASTSNVSYACELGEYAGFLNDPVSGLEVDHGMLKVPSGPGLGVSLAV